MNNLNDATELGALLFSEHEIKIILTAEPTDLKTAILKGQLMTEAEVRKIVIQQAKSGSGEAQKLVEKWTQRIKIQQRR